MSTTYGESEAADEHPDHDRDQDPQICGEGGKTIGMVRCLPVLT